MLDDAQRRLLTERWTLEQPAEVDTSTGPSAVYLDGVAMLLADREEWRAWLEAELDGAWPVAQGQSGALLLGILGYGTLHAWGGGRRMGPEWRSLPPAGVERVALVDDCRFTGNTMSELRRACEARGWVVVREIVCAERAE